MLWALVGSASELPTRDLGQIKTTVGASMDKIISVWGESNGDRQPQGCVGDQDPPKMRGVHWISLVVSKVQQTKSIETVEQIVWTNY